MDNFMTCRSGETSHVGAVGGSITLRWNWSNILDKLRKAECRILHRNMTAWFSDSPKSFNKRLKSIIVIGLIFLIIF